MNALPLNSSARIARREPIHVRYRHSIEITRNRLLQRAGGHGKAQRPQCVTAAEPAEDQSRRKAVAAANPIDEAHDVALAFVERALGRVEEHGAPRVVARRQTLAKRDGD